jgi:hypothetical protein
VVHHDVGKDMRSIERLDPKRADYSIAAAPPSVSVLVTKNETYSILQDRWGGRRGQKGACGDQGKQAFCGAISNGPSVFTFAEWPSTLSWQTVITTGIGQFVDHLIVH